MNVTLKRAGIGVAPLIHRMQREAFAGLLERYQDFDTNPACESIDRIRARLEQPFSYFYLIFADDALAGAIRVVDRKDGSAKRISPLFVLPVFRGRGIAQAAVRACEAIHGADRWSLGTILQEPGNCHLYEKLGYHANGETLVINDKMTLVFYDR